MSGISYASNDEDTPFEWGRTEVTPMDARIAHLIREVTWNPGASEKSMREVESSFQISLPADYLDLMAETNGAAGFVGNSFLRLLPLEELSRSNARLNTAECAPGLLIFGSDGGGMAYAFDTSKHPMSVVEIDFVTIGIDEAKFCGRTFTQFLEYLYNKP